MVTDETIRPAQLSRSHTYHILTFYHFINKWPPTRLSARLSLAITHIRVAIRPAQLSRSHNPTIPMSHPFHSQSQPFSFVNTIHILIKHTLHNSTNNIHNLNHNHICNSNHIQFTIPITIATTSTFPFTMTISFTT